jgi:hypothetical protein
MQAIMRGLVVVMVALAGVSRAEGAASFRKDVAPILLKNCVTCHDAEKAKGKYRLDTFELMMKPGGSDAKPVVGGKTGESELFRLITTHDEDERMPQKGEALKEGEIAMIKRWIEEGAKFDGRDRTAALASLVEEREHPAPPEVYKRPVAVTAVALSPDGNEIAVSGYHEVTVWDMEGKLKGRITKVAERTAGVAYSPDGKWMVIVGGTPGSYGEARLCEAEGKKSVAVLDRITDMMLTAAFSPDGKHLAVGGADNLIRIYDMESRERELIVEQHADWVMDPQVGTSRRGFAM